MGSRQRYQGTRYPTTQTTFFQIDDDNENSGDCENKKKEHVGVNVENVPPFSRQHQQSGKKRKRGNEQVITQGVNQKGSLWDIWDDIDDDLSSDDDEEEERVDMDVIDSEDDDD